MSTGLSNPDYSPEYSIVVNWRNWNDKRSETAKTLKHAHCIDQSWGIPIVSHERP